jgi:hypothetical protein
MLMPSMFSEIVWLCIGTGHNVESGGLPAISSLPRWDCA